MILIRKKNHIQRPVAENSSNLLQQNKPQAQKDSSLPEIRIQC